MPGKTAFFSVKAKKPKYLHNLINFAKTMLIMIQILNAELFRISNNFKVQR